MCVIFDIIRTRQRRVDQLDPSVRMEYDTKRKQFFRKQVMQIRDELKFAKLDSVLRRREKIRDVFLQEFYDLQNDEHQVPWKIAIKKGQ